MYHKPALLEETIQGLNINPDGVYVDVTFGGGGHSKEILSHLSSEGRLIAFDQDPDAEQNSIQDPRFTLVKQNFSFLKNYLRMYHAIPVDGILADLGVSFHQFDVAERGFSFRFSGPLDMRMDKARKLTAAKIVNSYVEEDLIRIFKSYGELHNAFKVVDRILKARAEAKIETIDQFKEVLKGMVPGKVEHKFFAQVFQALRIEVNEELLVIEQMIDQSAEVLKEEGRLAVITYHSLEDRLIKNYFRTGNFNGDVKKDFFGNVERPLNPVNRKPIVPTEKEIKDNNRSRSAKLRVATKLN
jgi:16S rRNA (cytosine1402-N4)-methyltransferase